MRHFDIKTLVPAITLVALCMTGTLFTTEAVAADIVISQKGKKFVPIKVNAKVGDTLTFVNEEKRKRHNVYSKSAGFKYLKIKKQKPGDRDSVTIKNAGTAVILCALHPKMKLTVVITK
jgi:plastocyanin